MRMKIYALYRSFVTLVDLDHMLRAKIIEFNLFVMRAGSYGIS
jgi:hypothetical protein